MNKQTIALLRTSFSEITRRRPDVAAVFYKRLFEVAPDVRAMFAPSTKEQQKKLTASLAQIVASLEQPEKLSDQIERLAKRQVKLEVKPAHYTIVGETLLWTFQQVLQQNFSKAVRAAWAEAYSTVAKKLMAAGGKPKAEDVVPSAKPAAKRSPAALDASKLSTRKAAAPRVKRTALAAAEGGKRKAARRPVRKTTRRIKRAS